MTKRFAWYQNKHFVIVSGIAEYRLHLTALLESFGARRIQAVKDTASALDLYRRRAPDYIICDYHLGTGSNGLQLLRQVIENGDYKFRCGFIVSCAERDLDEVRAALIHSPDDIWTVPLQKDQVRQRLTNLIAQKAALKSIEEALDDQNYQLAIQLAQEKVGRVPKLAIHCLRMMATAFMRQGDHENAKQVYARILSNEELDWALLGRASCQLESGDDLDCIETCDQVLARHNFCIDAYLFKAEALERLGELQQAAEQLARAAEFAPTEPAVMRKLGRLALRLRDVPTFASCFRRMVKLAESDSAIQLRSDDLVHYARGLFAMFLAVAPIKGKRFLNELQDVLRKQRRRFVDEPQVALPFQLIEARMLAHQNFPDRADSLIDEVLENCLQLHPELLLREEIELTYEACPDSPVAVKLHEQVNAGETVIYSVKPDAVRSQNLNREGMNCFQQGELTAAKQRFIDAFRYAPDNISVALNLLQTLLKIMERQGRNDDDIDRCRRCVLAAQALPTADNRRNHLDVLKVKLNDIRYRVQKEVSYD